MSKAATTPTVGAEIAWGLLKVAPTEVGSRIRMARQRKDLSLADLGKLVQRSSQAVQQWEVGQAEPGLARLLEMAKQLSVDPFWLIAGVKARIDAEWEHKALREATISEEEEEIIEEDEFSGDALSEFAAAPRRRHVAKLRGRRLRVLRKVEMMPMAIAELNFANQVSLSDVVSHFDCSEDAIAFEITTRRNAPLFEPGDLVIIDSESAQMAHPGAMVLVAMDDQLVFGQLHESEGGAMMLLSSNSRWQHIDLDPPVDKGKSRPADAKGGWRIVGVMVEHTTPRSEREAWGAAALRKDS